LLRLGSQTVHKRKVPLKVHRPSLAGLTYPKSLFLRSGERQTIRVQVQRQEYKGPIDLTLDGLPPDLTFAPITIPSQESTAILEVNATPETKDWSGRIGLSAQVGSIKLWNSSLDAFVVKPMGLRVLPIPDFALKPGDSHKLLVRVDRQRYSG